MTAYKSLKALLFHLPIYCMQLAPCFSMFKNDLNMSKPLKNWLSTIWPGWRNIRTWSLKLAKQRRWIWLWLLPWYPESPELEPSWRMDGNPQAMALALCRFITTMNPIQDGSRATPMCWPQCLRSQDFSFFFFVMFYVFFMSFKLKWVYSWETGHSLPYWDYFNSG